MATAMISPVAVLRDALLRALRSALLRMRLIEDIDMMQTTGRTRS
jgi:hypothetical protein